MSYTFRFGSRKTGEVLEVDGDALRLSRMRRRLRAFARSVPCGLDYITVTLTYRAVNGWSSRHVSTFMRHVRRHLGDRLVAYAWVAELQRRGAVHYHVILAVTRGARIPKPDAAGWWEHGMTRVERVRGIKSTWGYLRKYVSKGSEFGELPKGLRLFAVAIRRSLSGPAWWLKYWSTPAWLRAELEVSGKVIAVGCILRRVSGGFLVADQFFESPWRFLGVLRDCNLV